MAARTLSKDPYKSYRFKVYFGETTGTPVAGMNNITALSRKTEAISYRTGTDSATSFSTPGLTSFEPITLSRGLTDDPAFHNWAQGVDPSDGYENKPDKVSKVRKEITIKLCDDNGAAVLEYKVHNCWVSEYQAMPDLSSDANEIAIQTVTLQHEGFEKKFITS